MDRSTVIVEDCTPRPAGGAVLTLQRGVSTWASWTFQPSDAGTEITVGSSPGCDWQVAAPGVPSVELLFTGQELFAWVEHVRDEIRCNDATLPLGFTRLRHDDRLDLGPARIVVALGSELESRSLRSSEAPRGSQQSRPASAHAAELRVRRGSSRLPAWTFSPGDTGRTVSIGAADECDLQIIAAGVEANELTVLYAGDTLLVRSERVEGPKLNGQYVTEEWQFLRDGDRLDLGTACIDVHVRSLDLVDSGERKIEPTVQTEPPAEEVKPTRAARTRHTKAFAREIRAKHTHSFARRAETEESTPTNEFTSEPTPTPEYVIEISTPTRKLTVEPKAPRKLSIAPPPPRNPVNESTLREREPSQRAVPQAVLQASRTLLEVRPPPPPRPRAVTERVEQPLDPELLGCLFEPAPTTTGPRKPHLYAVALVAIIGAYVGWLAVLERWWPGW